MSDNVNDRGLSRKHIFEGVHNSLRRLQTDYIDLYQCHEFDPDVELYEIVRTMDDLTRQGKILYWGLSKWPAEQIESVCRARARDQRVPTGLHAGRVQPRHPRASRRTACRRRACAKASACSPSARSSRAS